MSDYVKKIQNLLDLAQSPNEYEARDALLKARKLMAKHKIMEQDLNHMDAQNVENKMTSVTYSARRDPWVGTLANIIAEHHCCRNYQTRGRGKQTATIGFVGLTDDIAICMEVFVYAVDCIRSVTDKWRKQKRVKDADGYGYGFICGLLKAYEKQQNEEGWGLVLVVPDEVNKSFDKSVTKTRRTNWAEKKLRQSDMRAYHKGIRDGEKFDITKRLKE